MASKMAPQTLDALRDLVAAGGALRGNLSFVADGGVPLGVAITLASRDPAGHTTAAHERTLARLAADARTCRGVVTVEQRRIYVEIRQGTVSPEELRRALHGPLSEELRVLQKLDVEGARNPPLGPVTAFDLGCSEISLAMSRMLLEDDPSSAAFFLKSTRAAASRALASRLDATFFAQPSPRRLAFPSLPAPGPCLYQPAMERLQQAQGWWFDALKVA